MSRHKRGNLNGYLFIAPVLIYITITAFIPMIMSLYLSFTDYNMLQPPKWCGLYNYKDLLGKDGKIWVAMRNTLIYALEVLPLNIFCSLGLAILVNKNLPGMSFFRTTYYLPVVTSMVAASMIWMWIYDTDMGLLNNILSLFGVEPIEWLTSPDMALHSLAIMRVWKGIGWNMVIYLAGLQGIPRHLYEAAMIDGASRWQQFANVTWPMLRPVTYYVLTMGLISTFQTFTEIYSMTRGGPLDSTTTIGYQIYKMAFDYMEMGKASALAFVLFVIIFTLSIINVKFFSSRVDSEV